MPPGIIGRRLCGGGIERRRVEERIEHSPHSLPRQSIPLPTTRGAHDRFNGDQRRKTPFKILLSLFFVSSTPWYKRSRRHFLKTIDPNRPTNKAKNNKTSSSIFLSSSEYAYYFLIRILVIFGYYKFFEVCLRLESIHLRTEVCLYIKPSPLLQTSSSNLTSVNTNPFTESTVKADPLN